ncbi:MAG: anti-sigma factor [Bacteroidetes bacterium]|nr:anti-sigma factor [Bacteroidota bacterium]
MNFDEYIASGIIEAYVMGVCTPEEKAEVETMRAQHPQVHEAIIAFEKEFEQHAMAAACVTGEALDQKILQSLENLETPVVPLKAVPASSGSRVFWLRAVAAAAVVLLVVSSVFNLNLYQKNKQQQAQLEEAAKTPPAVSLPGKDYAVLRDTAITPVAMYGVAPYTLCRCTMWWDKKTGKAYIMIHHLIPSPADKKYQLWATVNNKMVNVGMVHDEIRDHFVELENVPNGATAFTVTLEDIGNNVTPTQSHTFLYGRI